MNRHLAITWSKSTNKVKKDRPKVWVSTTKVLFLNLLDLSRFLAANLCRFGVYVEKKRKGHFRTGKQAKR